MSPNDSSSGLIANKSIELLTAHTPNGSRIAILLEELKEAYDQDYTAQNIDIFQKNTQKEPWFTKLNPNGRVPVIVDHNKGGYAVMEGLAIMNYLTRHYDPEHKFSFADPLEQCTVEQWLAWQHGSLGPIQAQANYYYRFSAARYAHPTQRSIGETERCYGVLNSRLASRDFLAGPNPRGCYSTADMAVWPFVNAAAVAGIELETMFPNVFAWWERVGERAAVKKGMMVPSGQEFPYGYRLMRRRAEEDPEGTEKREAPLKEALERAQREFGYEYKSP